MIDTNFIFTFIFDLFFYSFIDGFLYYFIYLTYNKYNFKSFENTISSSLIISFIICSIAYTVGYGIITNIISLFFIGMFFLFKFKNNFLDICKIMVICGLCVFSFEHFINYIFILNGTNIMGEKIDSFIRFICFISCKIVEIFSIYIWRCFRMKVGFGTVTRR